MMPSLLLDVTGARMYSKQVSVAVTELDRYLILYRHEEDGVQDQAVAREVLRLLHLQESYRNQVIHSQGARYLLC